MGPLVHHPTGPGTSTPTRAARYRLVLMRDSLRAPSKPVFVGIGSRIVAALSNHLGLLDAFVVGILCVVSALVMLRHFEPLAGPGDTQVFEYTGYYVARNLKLGYLPTLSLENNQVFYPYGTNSVFQPWGFERDCFYAVLQSFISPGPWLAIYYVFSIVVTGVGGYAVARRDLGRVRALLVSCVPALLNFNALAGYPFQYGYTIVHWTVLGIVVDFLIVRRVLQRQLVGIRLVLGRCLLLVLALGQDLTYGAGFALLSAVVSCAFVSLVYVARASGSWSPSRRDSMSRSFFKAEKLRPLGLWLPELLLVLGTVGAAWLYVPLVVQIVRASNTYDLGGVPSGVWWVNPFRLLLPFLPSFHPMTPGARGLFNDMRVSDAPEGSPGLFLVIIAVMGLWQARRVWQSFAPLGIFLGLCLLYHPKFRTLNLFPWFEFFRVGGRSTTFYPVVFALFATGVHWERFASGHYRGGLAVLVGLCGVEAYTAYSAVLRLPDWRMDSSARNYMAQLKRQPGEAVLDWPFCAMGGNGVGAELCPGEPRMLGVFSFRRFHEKKVMGQYFGRLHPDQTKPYIAAGWDRLLAKMDPSTPPVDRSSCLAPAEWRFFTEFFRLNDFAGINLWIDELPKLCVDEFHARFGNPTALAYFPGIGRVEYLPKPAGLAGQVEPLAGMKLGLGLPLAHPGVAP
jgi:hypothetical protein